MLIPYKPQFVERIFTSQDGRQFRVVFLVSLVNGEIKGHIVSAQLLSKHSLSGRGAVESVIYLPISTPDVKAKSEYIPAYTPAVSPYSELFFFNSQPTRAPSL